jgi:acetoin utilization deacetylase AcuC-like enzyme
LHVKVSHHPAYAMLLPDGHPFPMSKYTLLREILLARGTVEPGDVVEPAEAPRELLELVHDPAYVDRVFRGALSPAEVRKLGVPWSPQLWRRSRLAVQGTLDAAVRALDAGLSGNLAGGTHHAFPAHGEGFCVFNDVAIAIRALQRAGRSERALVVDLDVHQGNGTAAIFGADPSVFTFSMHGERNYPLAKESSTLDIGLADGTDDATYLATLGRHLSVVLARSAPDIVFYLAGVDVAAGDRYGKLDLSEAGVRARDRLVVESVRRAGAALVITLAGGYAPTPRRTAELHAIVFEEARAFERAAQVAA